MFPTNNRREPRGTLLGGVCRHNSGWWMEKPSTSWCGQKGRDWSPGPRDSARPAVGSGQVAQDVGISGTACLASGLSARGWIRSLPPSPLKIPLPTPDVCLCWRRLTSAWFLFGNPERSTQLPSMALRIITGAAQVRCPHLDHFLQVTSGVLPVLEIPSSASGGEEGLPGDNTFDSL